MEAAGKRYIQYGSRSDEITVWVLADVHLGNRACSETQLDTDIERIRTDPYSFWFGCGDYADYIGLKDKRFDPDSVDDKITVKDMGQLGHYLTRRVRDKFKPIASKCMGLLFGNHEREYQRHLEQLDLHGWLCTELGVANLGYSCFCDVVFVRSARIKNPKLSLTMPTWTNGSCHCTAVRWMLHHGSGFASTPGGKLNNLIRAMDSHEADVYALAHVHDQKAQRLVTMSADSACTKLTAKERLGIITGSYLRTYAQGVTSYGEQRGYRPTPLGARYVRIRPMTGELRAEV